MKSFSFQIIVYTFLIFAELIFTQDNKVHEFKISPNPTNGIVNVDVRFADYDYTGESYNYSTLLEVYNLNGELILTRPITVYIGAYSIISDTFYLTEYSSGIYLVIIRTFSYPFGDLLVSKLLLSK